MSNSARPHRRQPTRLPCPWDSPGKNTGVGCHFLLQCMKVKSESEDSQLYPTQRPHGLQPTRLLRPWGFPGRSTGVGCQCLLWVSEAALSIPVLKYFLLRTLIKGILLGTMSTNFLYIKCLDYTTPTSGEVIPLVEESIF